MNFRQIEVFKAVIESGTITAAAKRLHVSQPAVSKLLGQFERDLGFAVFDRVRGRLVPTAEARALYEQVERAFISIDGLRRFATDLRELKRGHLVVAGYPALSNSWLPRCVGRFLAGRDDVTISLQTRTSITILEWAAAQQIDLGLAMRTADDPSVTNEPLMDLEAVCVLPQDHRLAGKRFVEAGDLRDERFVSLSTIDRSRQMIDAAFDAGQVGRRLQVDTVLSSVACALVVEGLGVLVTDPVSAVDNAHRGLLVRGFRPRLVFPVRMLRPVHRRRSGVADAFVAELRRSARKDPPFEAAALLFDRH